jgi:hypothetical protein
MGMASEIPARDFGVEVRVDRRVEAFAIVQYLADRLDAFPSPYQSAVEDHFRPYQDHPAVKLVRNMMNIDTLPKGIHSESCMLAMYLHRDLEGAYPLNDEDSSVYGDYYGYARIEKLFRLLPDFMEKSSFSEFRKGMTPYYERWEREMKSFLDKMDPVKPFDKLYGTKSHWLLILNPLKKIQSAHATRTIPSFNRDTNCFSYSFRAEGVKDSVTFLKSERKMRDLCWHEGTHLVLGNGTFVRYKEELLRFSGQFDSCRARIRETFGYEKWLRYLDECIAYGASLYLLKKENPERFPYQKLLMKYNGFAHTRQVLDAFERYDAMEDKQKEVPKDLYPILIRELEKVERGKSELATDYKALKKRGMKMEKARKTERQ